RSWPAPPFWALPDISSTRAPFAEKGARGSILEGQPVQPQGGDADRTAFGVLLDAVDGLSVRKGGQPPLQPQRIAARRRRRSDALVSPNDVDIGLALAAAQARAVRLEHGGQP